MTLLKPELLRRMDRERVMDTGTDGDEFMDKIKKSSNVEETVKQRIKNKEYR
jgi:hypothetical protein